MEDIEQGARKQLRRLDGFPSLAHFISEDSDVAIFRKSDELGARNLLYLQSNLNQLEAQLKGLDAEDTTCAPGNSEVRKSARAYESLKTAAEYQVFTSTASLDRINGNMNENIKDWSNYAHLRVDLHRKIKDAMREYSAPWKNPVIDTPLN